MTPERRRGPGTARGRALRRLVLGSTLSAVGVAFLALAMADGDNTRQRPRSDDDDVVSGVVVDGRCASTDVREQRMIRPDAPPSATFVHFRCATGLMHIDPGPGPMPALGERVSGRLGLALDGDPNSFTISGLEVRLDPPRQQSRSGNRWRLPDWLTGRIAMVLAAGALFAGVQLAAGSARSFRLVRRPGWEPATVRSRSPRLADDVRPTVLPHAPAPNNPPEPPQLDALQSATDEWWVATREKEFAVVPVGSAKSLRRIREAPEVFVLRNDTEIAIAEPGSGTVVHAIAAANAPHTPAAWVAGTFERELARHRFGTRIVNITAVAVAVGLFAFLASYGAWTAFPVVLAVAITAVSAAAVALLSVRALRIGAWGEGDDLVISNFWRTRRVPLERISHFDGTRSGNVVVAAAIEHGGRVHRITGIGLVGARGAERIVALNHAFLALRPNSTTPLPPAPPAPPQPR